MPNYAFDNELLRYLIIAGKRSPGVVTLSGHDRSIGWDIKKGPGQSGATTTRTSEDPVEFEASFYLVQDFAEGVDDIEAWLEFEKIVRSSVSGKTPKALDIYHPELAKNDIKSVVLKSFGGAVWDDRGGCTIKIKFLEYKPPATKTGSPYGSQLKKENKAALDELDKLVKEYQRTPWTKGGTP